MLRADAKSFILDISRSSVEGVSGVLKQNKRKEKQSRIMSACLCLFQLWEVRGVMAFARTVVPEVLSSLSVRDRKVFSCFCVFCSLPSQLPAVSTQRTRKLEDRRTRTGGSLCLPRGLGCTLGTEYWLFFVCEAGPAAGAQPPSSEVLSWEEGSRAQPARCGHQPRGAPLPGCRVRWRWGQRM